MLMSGSIPLITEVRIFTRLMPFASLNTSPEYACALVPVIASSTPFPVPASLILPFVAPNLMYLSDFSFPLVSTKLWIFKLTALSSFLLKPSLRSISKDLLYIADAWLMESDNALSLFIFGKGMTVAVAPSPMVMVL